MSFSFRYCSRFQFFVLKLQRQVVGTILRVFEVTAMTFPQWLASLASFCHCACVRHNVTFNVSVIILRRLLAFLQRFTALVN